MRIYFWTRNPHVPQIEEQRFINIQPLKFISTANHLAFSIAIACDVEKKSCQDVFTKYMGEFKSTENLLKKHPLPENFNFDACNLADRLAEHFTLTHAEINKDIICENDNLSQQQIILHTSLPNPLPSPSITWADLHKKVDEITREMDAKEIPYPFQTMVENLWRYIQTNKVNATFQLLLFATLTHEIINNEEFNATLSSSIVSHVLSIFVGTLLSGLLLPRMDRFFADRAQVKINETAMIPYHALHVVNTGTRFNLFTPPTSVEQNAQTHNPASPSLR